MKKQINMAILESLFDLDLPIIVTKAFAGDKTHFPFQRRLILRREDELMEFYGVVALSARYKVFEIEILQSLEGRLNTQYIPMKHLLMLVLEENEYHEQICTRCLRTIVMSKPPDDMNEMEFRSFQATMGEWADKGYIPVGMHPGRSSQFYKPEPCPLCTAKPGGRVDYIFKKQMQTT